VDLFEKCSLRFLCVSFWRTYAFRKEVYEATHRKWLERSGKQSRLTKVLLRMAKLLIRFPFYLCSGSKVSLLPSFRNKLVCSLRTTLKRSSEARAVRNLRQRLSLLKRAGTLKSMSTPASIAKHPLHPMLVVFPIGLWIFSLIADFIFLSGGDARWNDVAFYTIAGGLVGALVAAVAGTL
jgi:hypothetical protein